MQDLKEHTDQCMTMASQPLGKVEQCSKSLSTQLQARAHCDATLPLYSGVLFSEQVATAALELWTVAAGVCLLLQDL